MTFHVLRSDRDSKIADCPTLDDARSALFAALIRAAEMNGVVLTDDFRAVVRMGADNAQPDERFTVGAVAFVIVPSPLYVDRA